MSRLTKNQITYLHVLATINQCIDMGLMKGEKPATDEGLALLRAAAEDERRPSEGEFREMAQDQIGDADVVKVLAAVYMGRLTTDSLKEMAS